MVGPHKVGPTSGVGQCLASHVSQGAEEWSDADHDDVLMCPQQYHEVHEKSDIGDSNSKAGPREVDPRLHTSYQLGRSLGHDSPCVWCG